MKDFKGILVGEKHRKQKLIGIMLSSFNQVKHNLSKDRMVLSGLKKKEIIRLFCEKHSIEDYPASKKGINRWLIEMYLDEGFELLTSADLRNYTLSDWRNLKNRVYEKYGRICMKCGDIEDMTIDHIKPYSIYPELSLEFDNMQVLCRSCNSKKGNRKIVDYRSHSSVD